MTKTIIFTDLDGTLLHPETYSFTEALPALNLIRSRGIPLVLCSSKTKAEIEVCRRRLQNNDPFIVENGGAIYLPAGYFEFPAGAPKGTDYTVTEFGKPYSEIRNTFMALRRDLNAAVRGFGDMSVQEISRLTGLSVEEAARARAREYEEPFIFEQGEDERFLRTIEERGLRWTRGIFYHLMGDQDKGTAVRLLKQWYERKYDKLITIGLGDGLNDLPLLREADHPVLIQKGDGSYDPGVRLPRLVKAEGIGPTGWNHALLELLNQ